MPVYEYRCHACGTQFDKLFLSLAQVSQQIACPSCQSTDVRRVFSAPAVLSSGNGKSAAGNNEEEEPKRPKIRELFGRKELNEVIRRRESGKFDDFD